MKYSSYGLQITKPAEKSLTELPQRILIQMLKKILSLQSYPRPQDCKVLHSHSKIYRVDQGEYRILYEINDDTVKVLKLGKRNDNEVYRNI